MRILLICENYPPHLGGAEVLLSNLAEKFVQQGHDVTVLTRRITGSARSELVNGVKIVRITSFDSRYLFSFLAIAAALKLSWKADIIQTVTFSATLPAWIAAKICRKPVVLTVLEVWVNKWNAITDFGKIKCWFHRTLERLIYCLPFDKYIAISQSTERDLLDIGITPAKIRQIYPGLNYDFWNEKSLNATKLKELRAKLRGDDEGLKLFFSWGRPGISKGFKCLVQAMKLINPTTQARLILMMDPASHYKNNYHQLLQLIEQEDLCKHIQIVDSVSSDELRYYVRAADLIIVPSLAEGFGYTAAEASAMYMPVIVSDAGSLPEVVSGTCLIFTSNNPEDLAAKIRLFSNNEMLKSELKYFHWENAVQAYLDCYNQLLENIENEKCRSLSF